MTQSVLTTIDPLGTASLTLNRPDTHNALDDSLIGLLTEELSRVEEDSGVRTVVLAANGKSFCIGVDVRWLRRMARESESDNFEDALALAKLMRTLNDLSKPTLALVHGAAHGSGAGLVACCDIAIANESANFRFAEVRLGLNPAIISPYVITAMGARAARRYFLTAERFDSSEARRLGLVHEVVAEGHLQAAGEKVLASLREGGPRAQDACKRLIATVEKAQLDDGLMEETVHRTAGISASAEGREGVQAFLENREPLWRKS